MSGPDRREDDDRIWSIVTMFIVLALAGLFAPAKAARKIPWGSVIWWGAGLAVLVGLAVGGSYIIHRANQRYDEERRQRLAPYRQCVAAGGTVIVTERGERSCILPRGTR